MTDISKGEAMLRLVVRDMDHRELIGIFIGLVKFDSGNILGGIIAIIIGLAVQGLMFLFMYLDSGSGSGSSHYVDEDCPYCGSGDTDGNHCYTCDDDF